jgi:hypothetical protein
MPLEPGRRILVAFDAMGHRAGFAAGNRWPIFRLGGILPETSNLKSGRSALLPVKQLHAQAKPPAYVLAEIDVTRSAVTSGKRCAGPMASNATSIRRPGSNGIYPGCDFRSAAPDAHRCDGV